jgi:prepilin-type N-terminal cleavage/methylation domain-containing protein
MHNKEKHNRKGFTLIELLVVVAIIGILTGILIPTVSKARASAKRTQCQANLHSIGQAIRAYMNDYHDYYPPMSQMRTRDLIDFGSSVTRYPMYYVLAPYVGVTSQKLSNKPSDDNSSPVFHCPADIIVDPEKEALSDDPVPQGVTTYFQWQGSSYEPRILLSQWDGDDNCWLVSKEYRAATASKNETEYVKWNQLAEDLPRMVLAHDYQMFHGKEGELNNRMALFADFHVAGMDEGQTDQK